MVWASALQDVAAGLGVSLTPTTDNMVSEYTAKFTPEAFLAREEAARLQVALAAEAPIDPDAPLLTPEGVSGEILRLRGVHGDKSGIDALKASAAVSFAPPVQLTQSSRSKYRDESAGYEDSLTLSNDGNGSAADEILALTSNPRYTAFFGGQDGSPRAGMKVNARGDRPPYPATVPDSTRVPSEPAEAIIQRAMRNRSTAAMFGLSSQLPAYEHDVTEPDYGSGDDNDAGATAQKINDLVAAHPGYFGRETPQSPNTVIRGLSPQQREQDEVRARAGHQPGRYSIPDLASGRLPTAAR
jgi:hypothetical protein